MGQSGYAQIGRFYLPLAMSGLLMTLQQPLVTAGIARTPNAGTALAAYGVALHLAVLLESPVQMLLPAANALVHDRPSYQLLCRFTLVMGLILSALLLLLACPPLGSLIILQLIGVPVPVAGQVFSALGVMALWPLAVGWRRFGQGLLIRYGHPRAVGYATAGRLLAIIVVLLMVSRTALPGSLVGGLALLGGAVAEAGVVTFCAMSVMKRGLPEKSGTMPAVHTLPALARFYLPLAMTSILTITTWPLITAGISHADMPAVSLAAWPVALSVLWLLTTPIQMLQQVAITLIQDARSHRMVVQFGLTVGLLGSLLLVFSAFTPFIELLLRHLVAVPAGVVPLVISALRILTPLPFVVAGQSLLQGLLISRGAGSCLRLAMMANIVVLSLLLLGGIADSRLPGVILAPIAMTGGLLAETIILLWKFATSATSPLRL